MIFKAFILLLGALSFFGCKQTYKYSLVDIQKLDKLSSYSAVKATPIATPTKTKMGATIENGAPFKFDLCVNNEIGELPRIKNVKLISLFEGEEAPVECQVNISEWISYGKISCIDNIASFDSKIESTVIYCLDLNIQDLDSIKVERTCWQFKRVTGMGEMTFQDVLNQ